MDRIKKKKGKKNANVPIHQVVKPTEKVVFIEPSNPVVKKSKKYPRSDQKGSDKDLVIKFPSDIFFYSAPVSMLKQADQLLFPEDKASLSMIGTSRAVPRGWLVFIRKDVKNLSKKVSSLTSSNAKIKKDFYEDRSAEAGAREAMKVANDKLPDLKEENLDKDIKIWEQWKSLKELEANDEDEDEEREDKAAIEPEKRNEVVGGLVGDISRKLNMMKIDPDQDH
ncbi:hypothetical protein Ddye_023610 [Dipteronia dyeriana]|uniref:Uncharacterized protein n=1 Tax=Dipteronia dyeriana TaxID=168575 RepID=A0AAD9TTR0_9ROSI|nr:hypothetical protein Ddye_023610 [Dipteronia dyeriana]